MSEVLALPRILWKRISNAAAMSSHAGMIDAVLVSYPKSGRTWFRFIVSSYLAEAFALKPAPDLHSMFKVMPNFDMEPVRGLPAFTFTHHDPKPPLIPVSHLPYSRRRFRHYPAVFMVRDPKDVMVSSYFHATRQKHRFSGEIGAFLGDQKQGVASLIGYLNGWAEGLKHCDHIVISYENLSHDPQSQTASVLKFLGLQPDPVILAHAIATAQFQNMRKLEHVSGLPGHDYDRSDEESLRMRRGKVGGYTDYLTTAQIAFIDEACARDLTPGAKALLAKAVH